MKLFDTVNNLEKFLKENPEDALRIYNEIKEKNKNKDQITVEEYFQNFGDAYENYMDQFKQKQKP